MAEGDAPPQERLAETKRSLDDELRKAVMRWHRLRWSAAGVLAFIVLLGLGGGAWRLNQDEQRLRAQDQYNLASCAFWSDVSQIPIVNAAGSDHPSLLGVSLVSDSRRAYVGKNCPGALPPPSPALLKGIAYYHLPPVP